MDDDMHKKDAENLHIAPEYGEQGEGPGEQPVRRIQIDEVKSGDIPEMAPKARAVEPTPAMRPSRGKAKRRASSMMATVAIVLVTVVVTAVVILAILILTQGSKNENNITETSNKKAASAETSSLTCEKTFSDGEVLEKAGGAQSMESTFIATYSSKKLADVSLQNVYTYADTGAAAEGVKKLENNYIDVYSDYQVSVDPFSSAFTQKDKSVTESHYAEAGDLTFENMSVFNLPENANGTTPGLRAVKKAYSDAGYSCKEKSNSES